jgi:catechol 2,3-dioxygenase-like lactoylglutathione lyase family enzyme
MINGAHAIIFSSDAEADRAFFKDVLGLPFVDAGGGWPIFALPPAEVAVHPDEHGGRHELYLLCADIDTAVAELESKGIRVERPVREEQWGRLATIHLPGGGALGIYQPKHPLASSGADQPGREIFNNPAGG